MEGRGAGAPFFFFFLYVWARLVAGRGSPSAPPSTPSTSPVERPSCRVTSEIRLGIYNLFVCTGYWPVDRIRVLSGRRSRHATVVGPVRAATKSHRGETALEGEAVGKRAGTTGRPVLRTVKP